MSPPTGRRGRGTADEVAALLTVDRDARRTLVAGSPDGPHGPLPDGIDFVEVLSNHVGTPGHVPGVPPGRTLVVHLLRRPVPRGWDASRVQVLGGVRHDPALNPVDVVWAYRATLVAADPDVDADARLDGVTPADRTLVRGAVPENRRERALVVRTSTHGDLSRYLLRILPPTGGTGDGAGGGAGDGAGDGVGEDAAQDPPLGQDRFAFAVDCPATADDVAPPAPVADPGASPLLDYLARDYPLLRTRLLDRFAGLVPDWQDRSPADVGVMLLELFAYQGDRLASWQDAIGVEAYLTTARRRPSVRRHARLLGYAMHDGCAARTWLTLNTDRSVLLRAGTAVADLLPDERAGLPAGPGHRTPEAVVEVGGIVMETLADVALEPTRNAVPLHSWGDPDHVLPAGSTAAFLAFPPADDPHLHAGHVLVLVDVPAPRTGPDGAPVPARAVDGDPARRYPVRLEREPVTWPDALAPGLVVQEVRWVADDALPGPLRVAERGSDGEPVVRAQALANVVLADQGASVLPELLDPPQVLPGRPYRPRTRRAHVTMADPTPPGASSSATAALRPDPQRARPRLVLEDGVRTWTVQPDLVSSSRLDQHVVVETEDTGVARLRFGDGVHGRRPPVGTVLRATYRVGEGARGNVAAGCLTYLLDLPDGRSPVLVDLHDGAAPVPGEADVTVWNPLPATGGADPEPLESVRQVAPHAFRRQLRAVTSADHAAFAEAQAGVQRAVARRRWTGSWYAQEVTVDPVAARSEDPGVPASVLDVLELRRMAGVDVEVARPVYVPLHLVLEACVRDGYLRADVEAQLVDALSSRVLPGGRRGLFHPDAFTFGDPLYLSDVVAAAMAVPGLDRVRLTTFARAGAPARDTAQALAAGRITVGPREVLRCDSDPNDPESGRVDVVLRGGA